MIIITDTEQIDRLIQQHPKTRVSVYPIFTDISRHPKINTVSLLVLDMGEVYALPLDHNDVEGISTDALSRVITWLSSLNVSLYTPSKVMTQHAFPTLDNLVDLKGIEYFQSGTNIAIEDLYSNIMRTTYGKFRQFGKLNRSIPIVKLVEFAIEYLTYLHSFEKNVSGYTYFNEVILTGCYLLEENGLHVDSELFVQAFGKDKYTLIQNDLVYSECNPYTTTGRVTTRRDGINYNALNKDSGVRQVFTSRFNDGMLAMADFEAFHLRLIAQLIGYTLPTGSIHTFFAKQYFQTDTPSVQQYAESKTITFKNLYHEKRDTNIDFFKHVDDFIISLWNDAGRNGFISTPAGKKLSLALIESPTPAKVFNYLLQAIESETLMQLIVRVGEFLKGKRSTVVLSTYDSVLFDIHSEEGACIQGLRDILECEGMYPTRFYTGTNYNELQQI